MLAGYRVERLLGRGGMGAVYLAEHVRLGRNVALKVLSPELAEKDDFRERFIRESRLAASIEHPNVIPVHDADEFEGVLFLAMRYVRGLDLKQLLEQQPEKRLSPEQVLPVIEAVAAGLDAAHARGLVHRDVKPANVLIEQPSAHVYVSDFGLAKLVDDTGLTRTGLFLGTVDYCAPEQIEGKEVDARTDVYALGCVLLECLTGQRPFLKDDDRAVIFAHLADPVPAVTTRRPELPSTLDGVVATAMAKYPSIRFSSCGALAVALRNALAVPAEGPTDARPERRLEETRAAETRPEPARPPAAPTRTAPQPSPAAPGRRRSRVAVGLAAAALVAVGAGAAAFAVLRGGDDDPTLTATSTAAPAIGDGFAQAVDDIVGRIAPQQRAVTDRIGSLVFTERALAGLESVTDELTSAVVRGQGAADVLAPANPQEQAVARELEDALSEHERYARAVSRLARTAAPGARQLRAVVAGAGRVATAYGLVAEALPELAAVPISEESHQRLLTLRPPSPRPAPTQQRAIQLAPLLNGPRPDDPVDEGRCFGPYRSGSYLQIAGARYSTSFVQCGDYDYGNPARANGDYTFRTPSGRAPARLVRLTALAGVDEASSSSQRGATVTWTVAYSGEDVCSTEATWGGRPSVGRLLDCRFPAGANDISRIVIRQRVSLVSGGQFWAGLANPVLTIAS